MLSDTIPSAEEPLCRIRRYQEILADFGRLAPAASDINSLLQLACTQAARGVGINHSKVLRYRPKMGDLLIVAGIGWKPGVVGHVALGTDVASLPGRALQTRKAVVTNDVPHDAGFRYPAVLSDHGIVSALNTPIVVDGAVWGVLEVDSATGRHFAADDTQFLCALANTLGLALHGRCGITRAEEAEARTALALARERTLLRELRHRSKNDLQLILSMLLMQQRKQTDPQAKRGFGHLMDRVVAIGLAHDQLVPSTEAGRIDLADYLEALCGNLAKRRDSVRIETELARAEMPHDRAVPLGLIVNELVTNALKYAFPGERRGKIQVEFRSTAEGEGRLSVRDDGIGMGPPRPGGSGMELVRSFVAQIGGRMEREDLQQGTGFSVCFPLVT